MYCEILNASVDTDDGPLNKFKGIKSKGGLKEDFCSLAMELMSRARKNNGMEKVRLLHEDISSHTNQLFDQPQPT